MKQLGSVAGLLAGLLMGIGAPVAAAAGSASIKLVAPSSVPVNTPFTVTASGHSPSKGKQFVIVFFTKHSRCASTAAAAKKRRDIALPFNGHQGFVEVPNGAYTVTTSGELLVQKPAHLRWCGYLYRGTKAANKPEAKASKITTVT